MRAVIQRVNRAEVRIGSEIVGRIGQGLVVLVAVGKGDTVETGETLADKIVNLRIFPDDQGKLNCSLLETGGSILCISQFTLYGDCRKGRRPSYDGAAPPELARPLYESFVQSLVAFGVSVQCGQFQAMMEVELVNDGPVTLLLDTAKVF
jgi:D-tyrosyl-tRNA(Tyr) deacylase